MYIHTIDRHFQIQSINDSEHFQNINKVGYQTNTNEQSPNRINQFYVKKYFKFGRLSKQTQMTFLIFPIIHHLAYYISY